MSDLSLPLGVIALPAIAPLIALIQLLFPGLLGEHWKAYRVAIAVLMSQSTLMFAQWIASFWVADGSWWLGPQALAWGLAAVAAVGFVVSLVMRPTMTEPAPAKIEYLALQGLGLAAVAWLAWQWVTSASLLDQMLVVAAACIGGVIHLLLRSRWATSNRQAAFATESVFLLIMASGGVALAQFVFVGFESKGQVAGESYMFRNDPQRSGSSDPSDPGPSQPVALGQPFEPSVLGGKLYLESTPIVGDGVLLIGGRHQIQATAAGLLFGATITADGRMTNEAPWRFGDQTTRAIFSSPALHNRYVYVGEGYHQHANCRLMCIDASGRLAWSFRTRSHVESPPTIVGEQIYFGAGDDGVYCLNLPPQQGDKPSVAWHYDSIHVDSSPLVVDDKVFVGGVVGDVVANLKVVALDRANGNKLWERPSELPFPAAASYADGAVYLGLGNGKFSSEAARPQGKVWRLSAETGEKQWEFPLESSVLTSPIPAEGRVHFVARNGECYALDAASGNRLWKYAAGEEIVAAPVVSGSRMFAVTLHGSVLCLDARTGQELWRFEQLRDTTASVYASPVLHAGKIYVAIAANVFCLGNAE